MKCREIEPLIYLIREGELTSVEKADVSRHLAACENCRKLYQSVFKMTKLIGQSRFSFAGEHSRANTGESVMKRIDAQKSPGIYGTHHWGILTLAKVMAASLLLLMITTFSVQQARFYQYKGELELRMHEAAVLSGKDSGETDCMDQLKRKLRTRHWSAFPQADEAIINKVNDEQLAQYIHQLCGAEEKDMKSIKKMLQQAGLVINNDTN